MSEFKNKLNLEEAKRLFESEFWKDMTAKDVAIFQINTDRLCMPFEVFHEAIGKALGRPVFNTALCDNRNGIIKELMGEKEAPTLEEIVNLIPEEKRSIVTLPE